MRDRAAGGRRTDGYAVGAERTDVRQRCTGHEPDKRHLDRLGSTGGSAAKTGSTAAESGAALAPADKTFAMHAAQGGLAEVQMGKLAAQNASSPDVKQFGQRMVGRSPEGERRTHVVGVEERRYAADRFRCQAQGRPG